MAPPSDDEITTHAEAARVATKATTARQAVDAELTRFTTEADCLTTDVARVQQDADRARRALVGTSLDLVPPQPDGASVVPAAPVQATIVAALHAQAVGVLNIKALVPVVLDNLSPNYTWWKTLFLNTLGKYELSSHVLRCAVGGHR
jgi:hypothetical protein